MKARSLVLLLALLAPLVAVTALADSPAPCYSDTNMARNYTHGSPLTGLPSRHGYYYLDVKLGPGCSLDAAGWIHLRAVLTPQAVLTAMGSLPGRPVTASDPLAYWVGFAVGGKGATIFPGSQYVTWTGDPMGCTPGSSAQTCLCPPTGSTTMTLSYDGPDVFGADARFRIANESGTILTDFASLSVVG